MDWSSFDDVGSAVAALVVLGWIVRPFRRRLVERWNQSAAQIVDFVWARTTGRLRRVLHARPTTRPRAHGEQPSHVRWLLDQCDRHLRRRLVESSRLQELRLDPACTTFEVLRVSALAIHAELRILMKLDATYAFAAALIPIAAWGPIYSVVSWRSGLSSTPMVIAESALKLALLATALTLGDPARSRLQIRFALAMLVVGLLLSLSFSVYVGPGLLPSVCTAGYKLAMCAGLVSVWTIWIQRPCLGWMRVTFALCAAVESLAILVAESYGQAAAGLVNVVLLVIAFRTTQFNDEVYPRLAGPSRDRQST